MHTKVSNLRKEVVEFVKEMENTKLWHGNLEDLKQKLDLLGKIKKFKLRRNSLKLAFDEGLA